MLFRRFFRGPFHQSGPANIFANSPACDGPGGCLICETGIDTIGLNFLKIGANYPNYDYYYDKNYDKNDEICKNKRSFSSIYKFAPKMGAMQLNSQHRMRCF